MPQVILKSGGSGKADKKSDESVKLSGDVTELPKPLLIGGGVVLLLIVGVVLFMFTRSPGVQQGSDHVAPPPGYPDVAPYNSKAWQAGGRKVTPGMPPMEALQRMNGGSSTPTGGASAPAGNTSSPAGGQ